MENSTQRHTRVKIVKHTYEYTYTAYTVYYTQHYWFGLCLCDYYIVIIFYHTALGKIIAFAPTNTHTLSRTHTLTFSTHRTWDFIESCKYGNRVEIIPHIFSKIKGNGERSFFCSLCGDNKATTMSKKNL